MSARAQVARTYPCSPTRTWPVGRASRSPSKHGPAGRTRRRGASCTRRWQRRAPNRGPRAPMPPSFRAGSTRTATGSASSSSRRQSSDGSCSRCTMSRRRWLRMRPLHTPPPPPSCGCGARVYHAVREMPSTVRPNCAQFYTPTGGFTVKWGRKEVLPATAACDYRYALSLPGYGYASRIRSLLLCGGTVIHKLHPSEEVRCARVLYESTTCTCACAAR
eukprot:4401018-Prymnesium_polylepis.1